MWILQTNRHLKPGTGMSDDGLDFGTTVVYTCKNGNCEPEGLYEEHCHVQPPPEE